MPMAVYSLSDEITDRVRQKMLATWGAIKKSLSCESNAPDVYDTEPCRRNSCVRNCRSGYSCKSISHLKGVAEGSKRHRIRLASRSLLSVRSSGTCDLKITRLDDGAHPRGIGRREGGSVAFAESLRAGSLGPRMFHGKNSPDLYSRNSGGSLVSRITTCEKCGVNLKRREAAEAHHHSKHAVTELVEGDPSRNVIERIVQAGQSNPENCLHIIRILKVHNLQTTLALFEEYREMVKIRAHNLPKKHPRCLADGNEVLRFYGTTFTCTLGGSGSPTLCRSDRCGVCCILRHGFTTNNASGPLLGLGTASTAEEAYKYIQLDDEIQHLGKALILCRVIAGRVQKPIDRSAGQAAQSCFDSLAVKLGPHYSIEKLYSLEPSALLPCFVIVCKH